MSIVYLNGELLQTDQAQISVMDRGFLFGDGVYEVIPCYRGKLFRLDDHLRRLENSLEAVRIRVDISRQRWSELLTMLVEKNGGGELSVYLQITRGAAPVRDHTIPGEIAPTIFIMTSPIAASPAVDAEAATGISAMTVEDCRWSRCDIKSILLLPNILMRAEAMDAGANEAILVRDGNAIEGAASNLFVVESGVILTPAKGPSILGGITRDVIIELAREEGLPLQETEISEARLAAADEIWISSSTREIVPVVSLNGCPVGAGTPGPVWKQMAIIYQDYKRSDRWLEST